MNRYLYSISSKKVRSIILIVMFFGSIASVNSQTFTERNGSLIFQAEDLDLKTNWVAESSVNGFRGSGYIVWKGEEFFREPGSAANILTANIRINTPGRYKFFWRSKVGRGTLTSEHNDTWLKFSNADDFYGEKDGERKYPKGSGITPNPEGASGDGFLKVFLNRTTNWTETAVTSDNEDFEIFVEFAQVGTYTMQLSPRSDFHLIDEINLNRVGEVTTADDDVVKDFTGRLAYSADGDEHDTDDWLASVWSLAMLRAAGLDNKLVFFEYNNHVWGTTDNWDEIQDRNIKGLVNLWGGFTSTDFYNYETEGTEAMNKLRDQINASSATDPLFIIAAGPIETIGRAVDAAQQDRLQYVTVVSHSVWNDEHANKSHGSKYTIDYLRNAGCVIRPVNDMNGDEDLGYTDFGLKRNVSVMENRLKNHPDERIQWLWTARKLPEYEKPRFQRGKYDYSDSGMTYWMITGATNGGDERVTPKKTMDLLQRYLDNPNRRPIASFKEPVPATVIEGYNSLQIEVEASDPDGDNISLVLNIDGNEIRRENAAPYEWGHTSSNPSTSTELLNLAIGEHLLEIIITDGKGGSTKISRIIRVVEEGVTFYSPIHDAYIESNSGLNNDVLRLESGRRTTYLQFEIPANPTGFIVNSATLSLTVGTDFGGGLISVFNSNDNEWTEQNINLASAPSKGTLLNTQSGPFEEGETYEFNVDRFVSANGKVTFILESDGTGADDVSFASKENSTYATPVLRVKLEQITGSNDLSKNEKLEIFPNPSLDGVFHLSKVEEWRVTNLKGELVLSGMSDTINLGNMLKGTYILRTNEKVTKLIKY